MDQDGAVAARKTRGDLGGIMKGRDVFGVLPTGYGKSMPPMDI
jgi:superfamily II DNA helicase RecQ